MDDEHIELLLENKRLGKESIEKKKDENEEEEEGKNNGKREQKQRGEI